MPHVDKEERLSYYKKHNATPERVKKRKTYYRTEKFKKYGISEEFYNQLLEDQDYSCAICKRHISNFKRSLSIDHDHETLQVRGLLCPRCNYYLVGNKTLEEVESVYNYLLKQRKVNGNL